MRYASLLSVLLLMPLSPALAYDSDEEPIDLRTLTPVAVRGDGDGKFRTLSVGGSTWKPGHDMGLVPVVDGPTVTMVVGRENLISGRENCYEIKVGFWRNASSVDAAQILRNAQSIEFKHSDMSEPLPLSRNSSYNFWRRQPSEFNSANPCIIYKLSADEITLLRKDGKRLSLDKALSEERAARDNSRPSGVMRQAVSDATAKVIPSNGVVAQDLAADQNPRRSTSGLAR